MKTRFGISRAVFGSMQVLLLAIALGALTSLTGCDLGFSWGEDPTPAWFPGRPYADSVTYLDNDSIILHGHFKSQHQELTVNKYFFHVHEQGPGVSNYTEYILQENVKWKFNNLDSLVRSEVQIPAVIPVPGFTTAFTLNIEVTNIKYVDGKPVDSGHYAIASESLTIVPAE